MIVIDPRVFAEVAKAIIDNKAHQAVKFISPKLTVKATRRHKFRSNATRQEFVFTYGAPAYKEALLIKKMVKAGEPFPVKKVMLKFKTAKKKPSAK